MARCRGSRCRAEVIFAITGKNKLLPVDPEPNPDGNVEITYDGLGRAHAIVHGQPPMTIDGVMHMPHWATCPDADEWRR